MKIVSFTSDISSIADDPRQVPKVGDRDHQHLQVLAGRELRAGVVRHVSQDALRHRGRQRREQNVGQISSPRQPEINQGGENGKKDIFEGKVKGFLCLLKKFLC